MNPIAQHIVCRLADSRVIAPTAMGRRLLARIVLKQCRGRQPLTFSIVDTHLHSEIAETRACCGELVRRIQISVQKTLRPGVGFEPAEYRPVRDQQHLRKAFDYILRQSEHHGLSWDPCFEASNLPDLLGARVLGTYTAGCLRHYLPRIHRTDLLSFLGLGELHEAEGPLEEIVPAALAAAGLPSCAPGPRRGWRSSAPSSRWRGIASARADSPTCSGSTARASFGCGNGRQAAPWSGPSACSSRSDD